jgi:hypothetical protein
MVALGSSAALGPPCFDLLSGPHFDRPVNRDSLSFEHLLSFHLDVPSES